MAAVTNLQLVSALYAAMFNRAPDQAGLTLWANQMFNGASLGSIASSFSQHEVFTTGIGALSDGAFIRALYTSILGSAGDAAGIAGWTARLATGESKASILASFVQVAMTVDLPALLTSGALSQADYTAALARQQTLTNKADVGIYYAETLGVRSNISPNTDASSKAALLTDTAYNTSVVMLASVTASPDSVAAAKSVIAALAGVAPAPELNTFFSLTTSTDSVKGTAANDTITATLSGTFGKGDVIDGGAGTDTLTVTDTSDINSSGVTVTNVEVASFTSASNVELTTTAWTGLTSLTAQGAGALSLTVGATTTVSAIDTSQFNAAIAITGGSSQTVTAAHNTGGTITLSGATGAVAVTSSVDAKASGGLITVNGGSTVSVIQTATNDAGTTVIAESAVTVNGSAATTTVTVTQAPVAVGTLAVVGVTGVAPIAGFAAGKGNLGVTAVTGVAQVNAVAAVSGVTANGTVTIIDANFNTGANSIASVTLNNYGASSMIRSNTLTNLSLSGTAGSLIIDAGAKSGSSTLALTVNGLSGSNTVTDLQNEITTLNVTTTGAASTLTAFADTGLRTLNVSGTQALNLGTLNSALTSIVISGAASFNDGNTSNLTGFATRGANATLTTTSTGRVTASIDGSTQSFDGSSGSATITLNPTNSFATNTIKAGSGTTDELILSGGNFQLNNTTMSKITGFEILGIANNVTGPIQVASMFNTIHFSTIRSDGVLLVLQTVPNNITVALDKGLASPLALQMVSGLVASKAAMTFNLGSSTLANGTFGTISATVIDTTTSIGTMNFVSNGPDMTGLTPNKNTVDIVANGLSTLNVSGTQGVLFKSLYEASTPATTVTINNTNTSSYGVRIGDGSGSDFRDDALTTLNFSGTGKTVITKLRVDVPTTLTINNTGTQTATITDLNSASITNLTLNGDIQFSNGQNGNNGALTLLSANSFTVNGATDNAHVRLATTGAATGQTHTITLGNGNNSITDNTQAYNAVVNLTVGTGANQIELGRTIDNNATFNITLGAGGDPSDLRVGTVGTSRNAIANYTIKGAEVGDRITFTTETGYISLAASTATNMNALLTQLVGKSHTALTANFGDGYTYVAEAYSGTITPDDVSVIRLLGTHTFTAGINSLTVES